MSEEMNLYKRCKNIFKAHGVDMSGGGESAPEVKNAIETHGLGWTDTEEKAGFDIQWDGNIEGHETIPVLMGGFCKVSDVLDIMNPIDNLIGANAIVSNGESVTVIAEDIETQDNKVFGLCESSIIIALEDGHIGEYDIPKGVWFMTMPQSIYVSRLYKEATTEEVVHQINQKYIPGGSGGSRFVVTVSMDFQTGDMTADKSFNDILAAVESNQNVMAKFMVTLGLESQLIGMYPFAAYEMPGLISFGYYYQGDIDGFALSVEQKESGEDLWDSAIVPHPDD